MAADGLGADLAVAAAAFVSTNIDNGLVTTAMVAAAPVERAHRIAAGQVAGFVVIVAAAAAAAVVLFEFSTAAVGLLGLVPLAIGLRGLWGLWGLRRGDDAGGDIGPAEAAQTTRRRGGRGRATDRAVGRSFTAAALVTIASAGDNLAVYIPLFRVGGLTDGATIAGVFVIGEVALTAFILWAGRHPRARAVLSRVGHVAVPILLCVVGILVMLQSGTFGLL